MPQADTELGQEYHTVKSQVTALAIGSAICAIAVPMAFIMGFAYMILGLMHASMADLPRSILFFMMAMINMGCHRSLRNQKADKEQEMDQLITAWRQQNKIDTNPDGGQIEEKSPEDAQTINTNIKSLAEFVDFISDRAFEKDERLSKVRDKAEKLQEAVKEIPHNADKMQRLNSFYLPEYKRIVEKWQFISDESKDKATETVCTAIDAVYQDIVSDAEMDVSADVSVMQQMLAMDGYKKSDWGTLKATPPKTANG